MRPQASRATTTDTLNLLVVFAQPPDLATGRVGHGSKAEQARSRLLIVERTPTVGNVGKELRLLGRAVATADLIADFRPKRGEPIEEATHLSGQVALQVPEVRISRLSYESPLEIGLIVSHGVLDSVAALAALIYGIKRLYGLDLELKTHREDRRAEFLEAEQRVQYLEAGTKDPEGWPRGTRERINELGMKSPEHTLAGEHAVLSDQD
jgi:hypothetical protein